MGARDAAGARGGGVVLFRETDAVCLRALARRADRERRAELHLGAVVRLRAPALREPGRYRVTIDAVTPVSHMIAGRTRPVTQPSMDTMQRCAGDLPAPRALDGRMHIASVVPRRPRARGHRRARAGIVGWVGASSSSATRPRRGRSARARRRNSAGARPMGWARARERGEDRRCLTRPRVCSGSRAGPPFAEGGALLSHLAGDWSRCWVCAGETHGRGSPIADWDGANFTGQTRVRYPRGQAICEPCLWVMARNSDVPGPHRQLAQLLVLYAEGEPLTIKSRATSPRCSRGSDAHTRAVVRGAREQRSEARRPHVPTNGAGARGRSSTRSSSSSRAT